MHKFLKNWSAKRSGTGLVVTGTDIETGKPARLTGIVSIVPRDAHVAAIDAAGMAHKLVLG